MRALIVEDDYVSRTILRRMLMAYGEVHMAADGEEGVSAFASALNAGNPFDLVCLDIMLPKLDGLSVLRKIRALEAAAGGKGKSIRVIMTTALNDKTYVVEAIKHCDGYLVKPYEKDKLMSYLADFGFAVV